MNCCEVQLKFLRDELALVHPELSHTEFLEKGLIHILATSLDLEILQTCRDGLVSAMVRPASDEGTPLGCKMLEIYLEVHAELLSESAVNIYNEKRRLLEQLEVVLFAFGTQCSKVSPSHTNLQGVFPAPVF